MFADSIGDTSPVLQRRFVKEMDKSNSNSTSKISATPSTSISQITTVVQKPSSIVSHRTLSKPLYVGAPSPDLKEEEIGSNNEGDNGEESSSDSPLGGISMKELISKTSPAKKEKVSSSSDIDQDSQDSHIIRMKVCLSG